MKTLLLLYIEKDIDLLIDTDSLFYLDNALNYGNGASRKLDQQSLRHALASLQVR